MIHFDYTLQPGKTRENIRVAADHKTVISVITPAWNPSDKIFNVANCILNQTYPYFEWLIIDDGSTNQESLEYFKELEKMDERIKVLHKKNEGLSKTRDYGIRHSSKETEYIVLIDDDDLLDKTFLECAYYSMNAHPEASWCYSDVVNFEGEESLWNKYFTSDAMKSENLLVSQAMIKKEAFEAVGGFEFDGNGYYEDWIFWLKLLAQKRIPIHMSYYGFWYRRKVASGQLKLAKSNAKRNMAMIKEYADKIKTPVTPIEYPKDDYHWDGITERIDTVVVPRFKKDKKKNILVMVPWMTLGGADKFNLDLFKMINKEKYRITLVSTQPTEYAWRQNFEAAGVEVFDLSTFLDRKDWVSFISYLIESRNIDILFNTNSVTGYMMLPYLHAQYPELPILDYIHMEEWYNRNGGYSRDSAAVGSVIDKTLFCNQNSEKILVDYFKRDPKTVGTVYIGVDAAKFDPSKYDKTRLREKYNVAMDRFVVSLVARIDYQKRPFLLMEIIKAVVKTNEIPNILFLIGGDGPLLGDIKRIARENNLDQYVRFIGKTNTPDEIYAISDMTLNCSIKEGLALTAYESLSMGVPVVSCDVGGQKELINEKTGVIVPCMQDETEIHNFDYAKEDIQNYVDGIIKIYKNQDKYKKACRKRILDGFTIENMVVNMEHVFDQLAKMKKEKESDLTKHIDILKELINEYFVGDKGQYAWLCNEYRMKVYGYLNDESVGRKQMLFRKLYAFGVKIKMPEEMDLAMHIGYEFIRQMKHFIEAIIMLPVLVVKFILKLFVLECRRIVRIIKRKVGA